LEDLTSIGRGRENAQRLTAFTESDFRTMAGWREETGSGATEGRRQWVRMAGELEVLESKERGTELGF